ncbi:hypothetical protein NM208_g4602 [Fusarium decemcellulare]|uniref:Uncharacterized protein n=1 Tax=Fusarium decemcellulare TaxID=57161 RepID=A0ACC1SK85_9HYPO|nr:hypothetical protein NM208_g4602 [Fusarium decemcellulare]
MATTIKTISPELLSQILKFVYQSQDGRPSSLLGCLLVCRRWRDHALPILYRHLVLRTNHLSRFLNSFNHQNFSSSTQSISLHLFQPRVTRGRHASAGANQTLDSFLRRLAKDVLPLALRLVNFSFTAKRDNPHGLYFYRETISVILSALPVGCVNVEIDTGNRDWNHDDASQVHLCHDIRALLPRLRNCRIKLRTMCSAMVGSHEEQGFCAVHLSPSMQSFVVNCISNQWEVNSRCTGHDESTAWHSVIKGLRRMVRQHETKAELVVIGATDDSDRLSCKTLLRCHIGSDITTWAMPIVNLPRTWDHKSNLYIRTEKAGFVGDGSVVIEEFAEGFRWKTMRSGARLPASVADTCLVPEKRIEVWTETEWRHRYQWNSSCSLWRNEEKAGMRLLDAQKRQDFELRCLVEITPDG